MFSLYSASVIYRYSFNGKSDICFRVEFLAAAFVSVQIVWSALMFSAFKNIALPKSGIQVGKQEVPKRENIVDSAAINMFISSRRPNRHSNCPT